MIDLSKIQFTTKGGFPLKKMFGEITLGASIWLDANEGQAAEEHVKAEIRRRIFMSAYKEVREQLATIERQVMEHPLPYDHWQKITAEFAKMWDLLKMP